MAPPTPAERRLRRALARNVRGERERQGLTLEEAADRADLHWRLWQKIEAGEVNSTLRTLARLGSALRCEVASLLSDSPR